MVSSSAMPAISASCSLVAASSYCLWSASIVSMADVCTIHLDISVVVGQSEHLPRDGWSDTGEMWPFLHTMHDPCCESPETAITAALCSVVWSVCVAKVAHVIPGKSFISSTSILCRGDVRVYCSPKCLTSTFCRW